MKELKRLLRPLKKKITINNLILRLFQSASIGALVILGVLASSKVVYVPYKTLMCIAIAVISILVGLFLALVKYKVTDYDAAEEGDRLGCNERLITAYGILSDGHERSPMEELVVKDAVNTAKISKLAENYKITYPKKLAIITAVLLAASCLTGFAPDAGVYEFTYTTQQALKETEEVKKTVEKDEKLSEMFKEEYSKILKDLNKDLKKAKDAKEAQKLINNAQKELKKLENKAIEDKNNIKNALSDFGAGSDISSAMDMNSSEALSKAMEKLSSEIQNLTDEELQELAKQLEELKNKLSDEELKEMIEKAEEAAKNGDAKETADKLSEAAKSALSKSNNTSSAVNRTASTLAKASDGTGKQSDNSGKTSTSQSGESQNGESQNGQSGNEGEGQGQGEGEGQGQGEGEGQGEGQGQGQGQGEGQGSGNEGGGRGFGHVEPEKVYTRDAEGLQGSEEQLNSEQTEDGEVTYSETKSGGVNGLSVPYESVVSDYMEQALKESQNGNIPYGMKEIVAEYFSGLEK